jgi:branched-chain amino acid transport system ATP-binding protein
LVVAEVGRSILLFRDAGITVLLVEQNASLALSLCDRGYLMETGRIVLSGTGAELRRDPKVAASYLGGARGRAPGPKALASPT